VWVGQEPLCAREALAEHERRKGQAFVLEELVNIPRCDAVAPRDFGDGQIALTEIRADVGHDGLQPRGGDTASLCNRSCTARGANSCRYEIMHVANSEPLQLRSGERQRLSDGSRIGGKQA